MDLEDVIGVLNVLGHQTISKEEFAESAALSQKMMPRLDDMQKLTLYGLYKQTTAGDAPTTVENIDKASPEYYKWQAWKSFHSVSNADAMRLYVYFVSQFQQVLELSGPSKVGAKDIEGVGSSVSTLFVDYSSQTAEWLSRSPLLEAVHSGDEEKIKILLEEDPSGINSRYDTDMTLLHFAADKGLVGTVKILLERGADVNARDSSGLTPLMYAIICSHEAVIEALLSSTTINLDIKNSDGESVWDLAAGEDEILALLTARA